MGQIRDIPGNPGRWQPYSIGSAIFTETKQNLLTAAFIFFFRTDYMDSPECLLILLSISVFLLFYFFTFLVFLFHFFLFSVCGKNRRFCWSECLQPFQGLTGPQKFHHNLVKCADSQRFLYILSFLINLRPAARLAAPITNQHSPAR